MFRKLANISWFQRHDSIVHCAKVPVYGRTIALGAMVASVALGCAEHMDATGNSPSGLSKQTSSSEPNGPADVSGPNPCIFFGGETNCAESAFDPVESEIDRNGGALYVDANGEVRGDDKPSKSVVNKKENDAEKVEQLQGAVPPSELINSSNLINAGSYAFAAATGATLEDMSSGTTLLITGDQDDTASAVTPIGFEFWFDGVRQTLFSVNSNGLMRLGVVGVGTTFSNDIASVTNIPQICPYWDDLRIGKNGRVHYKIVGSAPNRKLVIEWQNEQIPRGAAAADGAGTFQAWLSESTGVIEFVYGTGMVANTTTGYTVGLSSAAMSFAAVTTATNTVSYTATANTQTTAIPAGTRYKFTPNLPLAPDPLSFTAVGLNTMTINWGDTNTAPNEVGYAIYRSVDGVNYEFITQTAANATSYTATGLASNTSWFWKVVAVTEGGVSAVTSGSQATTAGTASGTILVGPTGVFPTLTAAITSLATTGLAGNVILELQDTYTSAGETFPLALGVLASPSNTVTIRPAAGALGLSITSANTTATIDLNGATNVIIDGRAGGVGPSQLKIENTATAGVAVRLVNGALRNTLRYCTITGVNTSTTGGVVLFGTSTGVTGNNNNTIDNCDIHDGATTPVNGITSIGTSNTALLNTGNVISNNNISNFFSAGSITNGILLALNTNLSNTGWTIANNRIFQTATRTYTTSNTHRGIQIAGGNDYAITGNTIGFADANGTGTYTLTGTVATGFQAIQVVFGNGQNTIQGNTVSGISLSTSTGTFAGINLTGGSADIGTTTPNTIGSATGTGAISLTATGTSGSFIVGMSVTGTAIGSVNLANNVVGSLTSTAAPTTGNTNIIGIQFTGGLVNASNNTVGGSAANSIQITTPGTSATGQQLIGILSQEIVPVIITNNTVQNLTNSGTGTVHIVRGIQVQGAASGVGSIPQAATVSSNTIHDITGANANTTVAGGGTGVQGLLYTAGSTGATISQNTIYTISATNAGAVATTSCGLGYSNPSNGTVTGNQIYDIRNASTMATATTPPMGIGLLIRGVTGLGGLFANNMISLGEGQTTNTQFVGIMSSFTAASVNSIYNSVHLGGTVSAGALPSYGFLRGDNSAASAITTPVNILNNIFDNTRTGGTGKHYAIGNVNTVPATGWGLTASNANLLNSPSSTTVGIWGLTTDQTLAQWRASSGGDGSSLSEVPVSFASPATADLHFLCGAGVTPVESHGVVVTGLTVDYDNQTRPGPAGSVNGGGTAPDLGADEFDCVPGCTAADQCSDNNPCTDDVCNLATSQCVFTANNANTCSDNSACTTDACLNGACVPTPIVCNDGNVCTTDSCNPTLGCVYTGNTNPCSDGDFCTNNDTCGTTFSSAYSENFDGVVAPALPAGWTTTQTGTGSLWVTTAANSHTAPNSAFGADGATISDELLVSDLIPITSSAAVLSFRNRWTFEGTTTCFDGGVLEISINGGSFTDIVVAGGTFISGGYNGAVPAATSNPITGRPAWCFASAGYPAYLTTQVQLPVAANGFPIRLRWRIGTDGSTGAAGQNIDTITISNPNYVCQAGSAVTCNDNNGCTDDSCNPASGCVFANNVAPCNDNNACTQLDVCAGGTCNGTNPVVCPAPTQCQVAGTCNPATGQCSTPNAPDGTSCNDNDGCTQTDVCQSGACNGTNPVICAPSDACHVAGVCNSATGVCSNPNAPDGTSCSDNNACTATDTCTAGACSGTAYACNPTTCQASSTCDGNGGCVVVNKSTGAVCTDDGNPCSTDVCDGVGSCTHPTLPDGTDCGGGTVCSGGSCGPQCFIAGQFYPAGQINPANACEQCVPGTSTTVWTARADGTTCDDNDACTQTDACQAGTCAGTNPVVCAAQDQCHVAGTCNPTTGQCSNPNAPNGTTCDDNNACTQTDACQAGTCTGANPVVCAAQDQCHVAGTCNPSTGQCSNPNAPNGTTCSDGDACTQTDTCQAGACTGANPVTCTAQGPCKVAGTCDSMTGQCSNPNAPDGTTCTDGDGCTQTDSCQAGTCTGTNPVVCTAQDQCHVAGTCNPTTGQCSNPNAANGTACNDNNSCTQTDACQAGTCTGTNPVVCTAQDQCHVVGTCNPTTGQCSNPNAPNGTTCSDGSACTQTDTCQAGTCTGANPVVCTPQGQCRLAGTCNPTTGQCSNPVAPDGDSCTDSNGCTQTDTCLAGNCVGANPVVCVAQGPCRSVGTCNPTTGQCSNPALPNGTACSDDNACTKTDSCQSGTCIGANTVICSALDQCHVAGICDPMNGQCSNPNAVDGTVCSDANVCTTGDTCQAGACLGTNSVTCTALDQCHVAGTCNPVTGQCNNPNAPDGTACDDSSACTQMDACQAGSCVGTNPITCTAVDQCHLPGTCDAATGMCSVPNAPDGQTCNDGDACTTTDTCQAGTCSGANPVVCMAQDECHDAGTCIPMLGTCDNPAKPDGTPCTNGTCQAGTCTTGSGGAGGTGGMAGAGGTGGSAGAGGAAGMGGTAGMGGVGGSAGAGGAGGAAGMGGAGGTAETGGAAGMGGIGGRGAFPTVSGGGCACTVPGAMNSENLGAIAGALGLAVLGMRRRRR